MDFWHFLFGGRVLFAVFIVQVGLNTRKNWKLKSESTVA